MNNNKIYITILQVENGFKLMKTEHDEAKEYIAKDEEHLRNLIFYLVGGKYETTKNKTTDVRKNK